MLTVEEATHRATVNALPEPKPMSSLVLLQTAQRFAKHLKLPLTRDLLDVSYGVSMSYGWTPGYILLEALQIAEDKQLFDKVPTEITLWK